MKMVKVFMNYCDHFGDLPKPDYQTSGAAGMDLLAALEKDLRVQAGEIVLVPTGICMEIPSGYEAQVRPRSGLALKHGITVLNSPGTVDSDYRGEIKVLLINLSGKDFVISRGMRIAQLVIGECVRAEIFEKDCLQYTDRNTGGFGHTGLK